MAEQLMDELRAIHLDGLLPTDDGALAELDAADQRVAAQACPKQSGAPVRVARSSPDPPDIDSTLHAFHPVRYGTSSVRGGEQNIAISGSLQEGSGGVGDPTP